VFSFLVVVPAGQPDGGLCRRTAAGVISPAQGQRPGEAEPKAPAAKRRGYSWG
jgi:hypothetical protein